MEVHGFTEDGFIEATIDGVLMTVPDTMTNRHRRMVAEWEAEGNTIPAYEAPPEPPATSLPLTKRQVVRAMIVGAGIVDPDAFIEAAISAISDPTTEALARADWRYAPYYSRDHALFSDADLLAATGLTPESIDALWAVGVQQPA